MPESNPAESRTDVFKRATKALVVLSGGQDSTTCLLWAKKRYQEVHAITFNYGQRHDIEIAAARQVARLIGVNSHEYVALGAGILKGRSPLTNPTEVLERYESFEKMDATIGDRVELTFVPMRNALFLTIAANRASCLGDCDIITGVCEADNANYPDCRREFINAQEKAIGTALGDQHREIHIDTPLIRMSKAESVRLVFEQGLGDFALLAFTHTAYDGLYPPKGNDHASLLRAQGFLEADLPDPLVLRAVFEGLMELPVSCNYNNSGLNTVITEHIHGLKRVLNS